MKESKAENLYYLNQYFLKTLKKNLKKENYLYFRTNYQTQEEQFPISQITPTLSTRYNYLFNFIIHFIIIIFQIFLYYIFFSVFIIFRFCFQKLLKIKFILIASPNFQKHLKVHYYQYLLFIQITQFMALFFTNYPNFAKFYYYLPN